MLRKNTISQLKHRLRRYSTCINDRAVTDILYPYIGGRKETACMVVFGGYSHAQRTKTVCLRCFENMCNHTPFDDNSQQMIIESVETICRDGANTPITFTN